MDVVINGADVRLTDAQLLGAGGEARVFRVGDLAVKILHPIATGLSADEEVVQQRARALKFEKIRRFPRTLPVAVVGPREVVLDRSGAPVGFTMPLVEGAHDAMKLAQRSWRHGVVSNASVCRVFADLRATLSDLHRAGVIVGDLNDGNVLVRIDPARAFLIDLDSAQFSGLPCTVAHERFLDPRLYGVDLARAVAPFDEGSDWFSFDVMLLSSLLYVHPYGGVHKAHATFLRRAEARWSILRDDVQRPRSSIDPRILPDELLDHLARTFDHDARAPIPEGLLESIRWTQCACGLQHARIACPACVTSNASRATTITRHGRCTAREVLRMRGRILSAVVQGGLKILYEEDGVLHREDGSIVASGAMAPGARFILAGSSTWIGLGSSVARLQNGAVQERASTGVFEGDSVIDANASRTYRLQDDWIVDASNGERIGSVVQGQTWLRVGEHLAFGAYRAGLLVHHFLFRTGKHGLSSVTLPPIDGRIVERDVVFDAGHILYSLAVDRGGIRTHHMFLLGADGGLLARASGRPDEHRMFASLRGKVLSGTRILAPTDDGLVLLEADVRLGVIGERTLFSDTRAFVSADTPLLPCPGGAVFVVSPDHIVRLDLA